MLPEKRPRKRAAYGLPPDMAAFLKSTQDLQTIMAGGVNSDGSLKSQAIRALLKFKGVDLKPLAELHGYHDTYLHQVIDRVRRDVRVEDILAASLGLEANIPGGDVLEYSQHPFLWMQSGCSAVAESLASWFAIPRGYREETWFWSDPNTAAPWEFLPPLATIRLNGEASKWLLMSLEDDKVNGQATVKLVEVF